MSQPETLQNKEEPAAVNIQETEKKIAGLNGKIAIKKIEIKNAIEALENTEWYKLKMTDADVETAKHNYEVANQKNANSPCWRAESPHLEQTCVDAYMNTVKKKEEARDEYNKEKKYAEALSTTLSKLEEEYQEALAEQPGDDITGNVPEVGHTYVKEL